VKRKEIDRRLSQLLDRIDGELAEIRDGLIQVDHKAGEAHHAYRARDDKMLEQANELHELRESVRGLSREVAGLVADNYSRKVPS
jgi:hypothetical protein